MACRQRKGAEDDEGNIKFVTEDPGDVTKDSIAGKSITLSKDLSHTRILILLYLFFIYE